jgi:hypothetical protein
MESIGSWFQDWSDACEYAKECAPDLSFAIPSEPYSALASIAAACFIIWWLNDRKIGRPRRVAVLASAPREVRAVRFGPLAPRLGWARIARPTENKKAA